MWKKAIILVALIPFIAPKTLIVNFYSGEDNEVSHEKNEPPPHTDYAKMARWLVHSKFLSQRVNKLNCGLLVI